MQHPSKEVQQAWVKFCDSICTWERSTGRTSALIYREQGEIVLRAASGKPIDDNDLLTDEDLILINTAA